MTGAAQLTAARPYDGHGTWPNDHEALGLVRNYLGELVGGVSLIARDFIFWMRVLR